MNSAKINTYIFDFDGTLVDSMPYWSEKMMRILRKSGVGYPSDVIKIITTLGDAGTARYFRETLGVTYSDDEMFEMMDGYAIPMYRDVIPAKDGVAEYLTMLKNAGCSLNVLTASPHKAVDPCLKRLGMYGMFDNVWSTDDFGLPKSDVRIYHEAVKRIGTDIGNAAFFDDNIGAVRTSKAAGLYTVGVYDDTAKDFTEEMKSTADIYVRSFRELTLL